MTIPVPYTAPEFEQQHTARWHQLGAMTKPQVIAEYWRVMREHGMTSLTGHHGWTHQDYLSSVLCIEREDAVRAFHFAEFGPGHEQCLTVNFVPQCAAMKERLA